LAVPPDSPRALPRRRLSPALDHRFQARPRRGLRTAPGDHVGPGGSPQVAAPALRPEYTACGAAGMGEEHPAPPSSSTSALAYCTDRGSAHCLWNPAVTGALRGADI